MEVTEKGVEMLCLDLCCCRLGLLWGFVYRPLGSDNRSTNVEVMILFHHENARSFHKPTIGLIAVFA